MNPPTESDLNTAIAHGLALVRKAAAGAAITTDELMLAILAFELSRSRGSKAELLFIDEVATKSPRLAWMEKHGIVTRESKLADIPQGLRWCAFFKGCEFNYQPRYGATEDEALAAVAKAHDFKLWNEEGA